MNLVEKEYKLDNVVDEIFEKIKDKEFIKFCAKVAPEVGITPEEWLDSKKKITFLLLMAKLEFDVEESYKKWEQNESKSK